MTTRTATEAAADTLIFTVQGDTAGLRLDKYLGQVAPHFSRSFFHALIAQKRNLSPPVKAI